MIVQCEPAEVKNTLYLDVPFAIPETPPMPETKKKFAYLNAVLHGKFCVCVCVCVCVCDFHMFFFLNFLFK